MMYPKFKKLPIVFLLFGVIFALLVTVSIVLFIKYQQAARTLSAITQESVSDLSGKVGRHVLLPSDETPTVLTVTDKLKLSGQTFFAHASNGDKVLVYEKAKKAFLYSVSRDLVLEIGPVTFDATQSGTSVTTNAPQQASSSPSPVVTDGAQKRPYTFFLLNGTSTVGLTKKFEPKLTQVIPDAIVMDRDNAKARYESSLLIAAAGADASETQRIAGLLGLTISPFPPGETAFTSSDSAKQPDFVIILGSDQ